jgi:hypothetical protein
VYIVPWFEELKNKYPLVYKEYPRAGVWIVDGWIPMVEKLSKELSDYLEIANIDDFQVDQIKEKFGSLRFYCSRPLDIGVREIISKYEDLSTKICTVCGEHANRYKDADGRFHLLCEPHINELGNK